MMRILASWGADAGANPMSKRMLAVIVGAMALGSMPPEKAVAQQASGGFTNSGTVNQSGGALNKPTTNQGTLNNSGTINNNGTWNGTPPTLAGPCPVAPSTTMAPSPTMPAAPSARRT